jgi:hypothetical protein
MENPMASIEHRPKVAAAFVKAQRQFAPALKNSTNPHFKSQYVDLAGCVEAVMDALNHEGIALVQRSHECDSGVNVETVFIHESGETMSAGTLHVPASKHDPQGYGSALTYARRYSLMAACGIAPADDDGNAASAKVSKEQVANIEALAEEVGKPIADINSYFGVKKVADLPAAQYQGIIKTLEKKREEQK